MKNEKIERLPDDITAVDSCGNVYYKVDGNAVNDRNNRFVRSRSEYFTQPSLTVNHHVHSLADLVDKYSRGIPVEGFGQPVVYNEDLRVPDLTRLDSVEKIEYVRNLQSRINEAQALYESNVVDESEGVDSVFTKMAKAIKVELKKHEPELKDDEKGSEKIST